VRIPPLEEFPQILIIFLFVCFFHLFYIGKV